MRPCGYSLRWDNYNLYGSALGPTPLAIDIEATILTSDSKVLVTALKRRYVTASRSTTESIYESLAAPYDSDVLFLVYVEAIEANLAAYETTHWDQCASTDE